MHEYADTLDKVLVFITIGLLNSCAIVFLIGWIVILMRTGRRLAWTGIAGSLVLLGIFLLQLCSYLEWLQFLFNHEFGIYIVMGILACFCFALGLVGLCFLWFAASTHPVGSAVVNEPPSRRRLRRRHRQYRRGAEPDEPEQQW